MTRQLDRLIARLRGSGQLTGTADLCCYCGTRNGFGMELFHLHLCESPECQAKSDRRKAGSVTCECSYKYLGNSVYEFQGRRYRHPD